MKLNISNYDKTEILKTTILVNSKVDKKNEKGTNHTSKIVQTIEKACSWQPIRILHHVFLWKANEKIRLNGKISYHNTTVG